MDEKKIREKTIACWLGKAVGGTLGQPYEGVPGPLNLDYYDPIPDDMIPNDDLDLQVLWACILDKMDEPIVDRQILGRAFLEHVNFPWDEYGVCIRNMRNNIMPPFSGGFDNWFEDGLGAAIRSEIWACIAPGEPELAAAYAYEDACIDHANDGIYAEMFLAGMESMAFVSNSIEECIDAGLAQISEDSRLYNALADTMSWCTEYSDSMQIRQMIIDKYGSDNFTDAVMNMPFFLLSVLHGNGDFSKTICLAVNCGRDADCTCASAGAFMGILDPECIDKRWLKPIGRKLVINEEITGIEHPSTLDAFTDLIMGLRYRINRRRPPECTAQMPAVTPVQFDAETWMISHLELTQSLRNCRVPQTGKDSKTVLFTSYLNHIASKDIQKNLFKVYRFQFELEKDMNVAVMCNTNANSRIWVDDKYLFGREGGAVVPAFHRCPVDQCVLVDLKNGTHTMIISLAPKKENQEIEFNIGLGDTADGQWLPKPFKKINVTHKNQSK